MMGPGYKAMLGNHVHNDMQSLIKRRKRENLMGKTLPKKRDMYNKEEKSHVTPLVKNSAPPRDLTNEDT